MLLYIASQLVNKHVKKNQNWYNFLKNTYIARDTIAKITTAQIEFIKGQFSWTFFNNYYFLNCFLNQTFKSASFILKPYKHLT